MHTLRRLHILYISLQSLYCILICIIFLNLKVMEYTQLFPLYKFQQQSYLSRHFPEHMQTFCIIIFWNTMSVILITSSIEMSNHLLSVYNLPESHCSVIHRSNLPHTSFPNSSMLKCPILKHALCFSHIRSVPDIRKNCPFNDFSRK